MVRFAFTAVLLFGVSALAGQAGNVAAQKNAAAQQQKAAAGAANQASGAGDNKVGAGQANQFITGPCASKADCASGCCTQRNGKVECAAPGALGVKDKANDPKCNAKAGGRAAKRLRV
ncbi:hypothetical protein HRG_006958 [Hirsutella rhossiliensis]|uniref:Biotrophy-associated secreted protein 2 n=1 Tax=Hirsutella rhossiliensis TaxID=111463 RepID=A0A9P8SGC3_9HYPO|nr:uncharacterized protein HRG_06958 [Hirsutella rhossiliensis]KAH0961878.1 hypothetical protein HRG_06958 [Hirsutella rhossiliensis]